LNQLNAGEKVVIHCDSGLQRSALVGGASLIALGFPLDVAYNLLGRAQPDAGLSVAQAHRLEVFAAYRQRRRKTA
jgi:protein-tyrosine phosphatase